MNREQINSLGTKFELHFGMKSNKLTANGSITDHRDLKVWIVAVELATDIYNLTKNLPKGEKYGLCSQMRRAAVSVASNIAEGAARGSRKEFIRFLYIASGSVSELETQLIILENVGLIQEKDALIKIRERLYGVKCMIHGLIRALRK